MTPSNTASWAPAPGLPSGFYFTIHKLLYSSGPGRFHAATGSGGRKKAHGGPWAKPLQGGGGDNDFTISLHFGNAGHNYNCLRIGDQSIYGYISRARSSSRAPGLLKLMSEKNRAAQAARFLLSTGKYWCNQLFNCRASTSLSLYESKMPTNASRMANCGFQFRSVIVPSIFGTRFCTSW